MISFYYAKPSLFSRPVWITLLEKGLAFEPISVNMEKGGQFAPEFRVLNPFCRIPVLVDDGFRMTESQAILDYLEAKYPQPALLPKAAKELAQVRMVQMVCINELMPAIGEMLMLKLDKQVYAKNRAVTALTLFEELLGDASYFGGEQLSLADIVAGVLVPVVYDLGLALDPHPRLQMWADRLTARKTWQQTQLSPAEKDRFLHSIPTLARIWQKRRRQRAAMLLQPSH